MSGITIQLPEMDADHNIEVEVKVNGNKKKYHYRIEIFSWEECSEDDHKAICLRKMINKYDKEWQLVHIGGDREKTIPILFKQRN